MFLGLNTTRGWIKYAVPDVASKLYEKNTRIVIKIQHKVERDGCF